MPKVFHIGGVKQSCFILRYAKSLLFIEVPNTTYSSIFGDSIIFGLPAWSFMNSQNFFYELEKRVKNIKGLSGRQVAMEVSRIPQSFISENWLPVIKSRKKNPTTFYLLVSPTSLHAP